MVDTVETSQDETRGSPLEDTLADALIPKSTVSAHLPFTPHKLWTQSHALRSAVRIWLLVCLVAVPSALLTRVFEWTGISIPIGDSFVHITVYVPMLFCVPLALWYGYWWAAIPAYLSSFFVASMGGMPLNWTFLFALANPLGLAVLVGLYSTTNMNTHLRSTRPLLTFAAFSLLAALTGSAGAFVWAHTNNVGLNAVFPIWQGWWLGGWLQNLLFIAPLLAMYGGRVERRIAQLNVRRPDSYISLSKSIPMVIMSVLILFAYVFAARYLAFLRIERFSIENLEPIASQRLLDMVSTLSYPIFLMTSVIIGLVYFGYRSLYRWTAQLKLLNQELRSQNKQLEQLATIDSLSGLFNRRKTFALMDVEFIRSKRTEQEMAIIMIDADYFKAINDSFGHKIGDQVIRQLAVRLEGALREYDVLGRYGGEEFIAMLPQTSAEQAWHVANRFRDIVLQHALSTSVGDVELTVSVGFSVQKPQDETFKDILERADNALYRAKAKGRNCVEAMLSEL